MGGCVVRGSLSLVLIKQNTVSLEKDDIFTTLKKKNAYTYQTQFYFFIFENMLLET